jgi:ATP-dependent DNA helicase RecG
MIFGIESETLEFKKTTAEAKDAVIDVVAMLNKHGRGELYFGIKNDGQVLGQMISGSTLRDVNRALTENIKPQIYPTVEMVNIDYKDCIRVQFEGDNVPYFAYGKAYIRVADECKQISPEELGSLFKKKRGMVSPWDSSPSGKTADDINTNFLRSYMKKANDSGRLSYKFTNRDDILRRLGLMSGGEPNNTAIAMFGKNPSLEIQMAVFATDVKHTFIDIDRANGTINQLVDIGEQYIRRNTRWRVVRDGAPQRTEIPEVPMDAVREALLNSYAHRDAEIPQVNEIAIYSNRIEIYNPGTFPEGLTPGDYINRSESSVQRNPLLAEIMYYSKDIERFGTGLQKIARECDGAGVRYGFKCGKLGFTVIFYRTEISGLGRDLEGDLTGSGQVTGQVTGQDTRNERLLEYCTVSRTRREMQEFMGIASRDYFNKTVLLPLLGSGKLRMTIPDKPNSRNQKYVRAGRK